MPVIGVRPFAHLHLTGSALVTSDLPMLAFGYTGKWPGIDHRR